jgi:ABC-type sugar transport system permease subunit
MFVIFFVFPLLYSFGLTVVDWNGFSPEKTFVGLNNYVELFNSRGFYNALTNSLIYTLATGVLSVTSALIFGVLLQEIKGYSLLKSVYFFPHIVSIVAVGVVWSWIYLPGSGGLLNSIFGLFNIKPQSWLADPKLSMISLIIIGVWKSLGYYMIVIIAGLLSISKTLYEASSIDGVGRFKQFFYITLPCMKPTLFFTAVSATTAALFQVFDIVNVTTGGGPVGSTEMLVTYLYKAGFTEYRMGYASAVAFVLFVITILITIVQKKFIDEK